MSESISGIYQIKNKANNKIYIGSSADIETRWYEHKRLLNSQKHPNPHLQSSWNKYGKDNFKFELIKETTKENCRFIEQKYLDKLDPEYNIANDTTNPMAGSSHQEETKQKISEAQSGERGYNAKLTRKQVLEIKRQIGLGIKTFQEIAENFDISTTTISNIKNIDSLSNTPYQKSLFKEQRIEQRQKDNGKYLEDYHKRGEKNDKTNLTKTEVRTIKQLKKQRGFNHYKLADIFDVSRPTIDNIINGKTLQHVKEEKNETTTVTKVRNIRFHGD